MEEGEGYQKRKRSEEAKEGYAEGGGGAPEMRA
jgi:hypothetical protein